MEENFDITNPGLEAFTQQKPPKRIVIPNNNQVPPVNNSNQIPPLANTTSINNSLHKKPQNEKRKNIDDEEEADKEAQERKDRYWEHIMEKISFYPKDENYYKEYKYAVKPGFGLFRALASARSGFSQLQINLPETLMAQDQNVYMLWTDETGRVRRKADSSWAEFEMNCRREHEGFTQRFYQSIQGQSKNRKFNDRMSIFDLYEKLDLKTNVECPVIILRGQGQNDWKMTQNVFQAKTLGEKRQTDSNGTSLEQRFIFSRPMKATVLRLVYMTKNSMNTKANYAFRIENHNEIFDPDTKKNINLKGCINSEKKNSFNIQNVKGTGLKEYERQADSLVRFLEKNNQVRISQLVLDFIQDLEGKIWLISMRSLRAVPTITMETIMSKKANPDEEDSKKTLDQLTCSVYCKLCGILFKKDDASKVLTYKLLWELVQHLKKRNIPLKNIKVSHSSTRPCRVCNLCYMLVVGEHELIEIEQKFAEAQNIPIQDAVVRVPIDTKPKHRPALLSETLNQWRLIFYICDVSNIGIEQKIDFSNLYFQYKLQNCKTSFKIPEPSTFARPNSPSSFNNNNNDISHNANKSGRSDNLKSPVSGVSMNQQQYKNQSHLDMNHIRVHYFFSEDLNIEKFLKDSQIKVRLTQGPDWNAFLAEGSSKTIQHFKNKDMGGQRHSSQILLFFENAKYCVLKINAGLVCDGEYNTGKLNLHKYNDIYFPDETFYNSNPFPDEWMEMFDPQYVSRKEDMKEQEGTEKYSPKCTPSELNKMIDFNPHKTKINVQSKVSQMIRAQSAVHLKSNSAINTNQRLPGAHQDQQMSTPQLQFIPFQQRQQMYDEQEDNNYNTNPNNMNKRATTAKEPLIKTATDNKKRPLTSVQNKKLNNINNNVDITNPDVDSDKKQQQNQLGAYGFILSKDDKKKRQEEMIAQFKKYGLQSEDEEERDEDDEEFDEIGEEAEEVIREKLREHFKQINKMNENQQDGQ